MQNASDELIRILDAEKISNFHLVGQAMGGYVSQIIARDHPQRVKSLTAIGSSPIQPKYYSTLDNWLLSITPIILQMYPYHWFIKATTQQILISKKGQLYALETLRKYSKVEIIMIMKKVYLGVKSYRENTALTVPILITYGDKDKTGRV